MIVQAYVLAMVKGGQSEKVATAPLTASQACTT